jgi:hypothetical protein
MGKEGNNTGNVNGIGDNMGKSVSGKGIISEGL